MKEPPIRTRTSDWSETFTNIKIKLDPDGKTTARNKSINWVNNIKLTSIN